MHEKQETTTQNDINLSDIAEKLKDRVLFPEALARAKELLKNIIFMPTASAQQYAADLYRPEEGFSREDIQEAYQEGFKEARQAITWKAIKGDDRPTEEVLTMDSATGRVMRGKIKTDGLETYCEIPGTSVWQPCTHYLTSTDWLKIPIE